ncbi:GNAT family N-acetyltransferase [Streptomyces sp. WAC 00631]|uniref:GNAT family N-acetyltransferase n=1 Tax=unclassified Streptomyces TaxID=2593676 RepID=UPI000F797D45|nr:MULTISPECIES: GNAT family N-acetyltransferase [unclassified Streptomyces]MCC5036585.1 GNAT family N-acetyltransferase [Streptomyces sp. WAC 00631]MCC9738269.1 GNAT family N-acetyltransferase [Streptomyces sp. MNU89]
MSQQDQRQVVIRRADRPGDLGWVVMAHGEAYDQQFGWNTDFEVLVAKIIADYGTKHDPAREAGWIAEIDGRRVGCIFLVASDRPEVARLRILLVAQEGRGLRLGTRLVEECLAFAREAGYEQVTLWTNDVLTAARRIYQSFGFTLADEERHHSYGHDLVGQNWTLDLRADAAGSAS